MNLPAATIKPLCSVCGGATDPVYRDLYDDRYGYPGAFTLYKCRACAHMYIATAFKPGDLGKLYTDYYPRGNFDLDSFRPEEEKRGFRSWLNGDYGSAFRWVPKNVRVLDIGCGIGATLAFHKKRGCEAYGIEADENVQAIAKRYGLDIRQGIFDGSQFESGYFDYVTLDQVAEHVTDPHALMQGVARVLKPGGKVIITTPNPQSWGARLFGRQWLHWHTPYHIQFYSRRSLDIIAKRAGLKLESARTVTASDWQYYQWRHVVDFPRQGERAAFWSGGNFPSRPHAWDGRIERARRLRLHRIVSRVLDMLGVGDNRVFILVKP